MRENRFEPQRRKGAKKPGRISLAWALMAFLGLASGSAAAAPLDLELPTLSGERFFRLAEVRDRVVLVNFWDTDCPPCRREMPLLDRVAQAHPQVLVLGVTLSPRRQALDYLERQPVSFLQLSAPREAFGLLRRFGDPSSALPHTAVLGRDHSLCARFTGEVTLPWLEAALERCRLWVGLQPDKGDLQKP